MATIFLDCFDDMLPLWERVRRDGDPTITVNIEPGQPADVPALIEGYDICIVDHTVFDADLLARCTDLRRILFLGTGASSFIDVVAAERLGIAVDTIKGYGDTAVAEHTMALVLPPRAVSRAWTPKSAPGSGVRSRASSSAARRWA